MVGRDANRKGLRGFSSSSAGSRAIGHYMRRIAALCVVGLLCVPASTLPAVVARPADGDLVFQSTGASTQGKAIELATHSPYSHMGIIFFRNGRAYVLEAAGPVRYTPLEAWIRRGDGERYVIRRLKGARNVLTPEAVRRLKRAAERFLGKPYDRYFGWSDDRIYCSELVWKVYRNALGIEIGTPVSLREFDLSHPLVKAKLKERYGDGVPLDEPVISPGQMFRSPMLETIASSSSRAGDSR